MPDSMGIRCSNCSHMTWWTIWIQNILNHKQAFSVWFPNHHLNTGPFECQTSAVFRWLLYWKLVLTNLLFVFVFRTRVCIRHFRPEDFIKTTDKPDRLHPRADPVIDTQKYPAIKREPIKVPQPTAPKTMVTHLKQHRTVKSRIIEIDWLNWKVILKLPWIFNTAMIKLHFIELYLHYLV